MLYGLVLLNINNAKAIEMQNQKTGQLQRGLVKRAKLIPRGIKIELNVLATNTGTLSQPNNWSKEMVVYDTFIVLPFNQEKKSSHSANKSPFYTITYPLDDSEEKIQILLFKEEDEFLQTGFGFLLN